MGRGKKKGAKEKGGEKGPEPTDDVPSMASLSVSETQPSTSTVVETPVQPKPEKTEEPKSEAKPEPEEGGLGLESAKYKKKRPPKKKKAGDAAAAAIPSESGQAPPSEPAGPAPVAPSAWGPKQASPAPGPPAPTGFPQPGYAPTHPQGQPGFPQAGLPGYPQPGPQGYPQPRPPGYPQPGPPGYPQPGLPGYPQAGPPGYPQAGPPSYPQTGPHGHPGHPQPAPQPSFAQPPQSFGRGQGRGQVPQQAPSRQVAPPSFPQPAQPSLPPPAQPGGRGQGRGQAQPQPTPPASAGRGQAKVDTAVVSRYSIPDKVIGRVSVPSIPIKVLTNYLPMRFQGLKVHRYDVAFKPERPKKALPRAFEVAKNHLFPQSVIAFDQMKNCYSLTPLPKVNADERLATQVELKDMNGKSMNFEVSFKATGIVDLNSIKNYMTTGGSSLNPPTEAIQCVDVILRQGTLQSYVKAGRQFFKRPDNPINLGDGLEMWTGLFQSAIFTTSAYINIDVAHKGFPKEQPLIDAISRDFRLDLNTAITQQRGRGVENFMHYIKGLRVLAAVGGDSSTRGQKREFICNDLAKPPHQIEFNFTDPKTQKQRKMTVADYFQKEKNIKLRYPNMNCMWVGPRDKNIYYPMELLHVVYGQAQNKQLNEMQLATMVREAATPPDQRKRKIQEVIRNMNYSSNPYFKKFGLEISDNFLEVEAKVLTAPNLEVGGRSIQPRKGQWNANRLLKPEVLEKWALITIELDPRASNGESIITLLKSCGTELGMRVSDPMDRYYNTPMRGLKTLLLRILETGCRFLVIVVPTRGRDYYHQVKQMAERDVGILTQCIREVTATRRMNPATAKNILLKVNSKLMGINQALDRGSIPLCLQQGGVMVVGADVTHPSPDQSSVPSIAAVTASIDPKCFIYNIQLSIQTPKKEMIVEFEDMMVEHLKVYMKRQGSLPRKIFVFRDGVSEGQFAQVIDLELQAVHRAYQRMTGNNSRPEILFLLVQKRHHTRFFSTGRQTSDNVEPGTVVDKHIVHAKELDFYLVSHQAIKGTARPTRYHAVCNDGAIPHDQVEQLTYYLCHLYSRCMRSVSYPTPTYYAHLACMRARSLTHGERFDNQELERKPRRLNVLEKMLDTSRMFFV